VYYDKFGQRFFHDGISSASVEDFVKAKNETDVGCFVYKIKFNRTIEKPHIIKCEKLLLKNETICEV